MKVTLKQFRDGKIEEAILAAEPPEEPKPAEKVQEPEAEPKASEKPKNTPKKDEAKTYCLRLSQEAIDKIDTYKQILGMTAGEFVLQLLNMWEENSPFFVKTAEQIKEAKKNMKLYMK